MNRFPIFAFNLNLRPYFLVDRQWLEPLQGRTNCIGLPPPVLTSDGCAAGWAAAVAVERVGGTGLPADTLLASGHHAVLKLEGRRLIVDACGGHTHRPLAAVVLPTRRIVFSKY